MPTVLDIARLDIPDGVQGRSVLPYLAERDDRIREYLPMVFNQNFGISDGRYNYGWFGDTGLDMLFDLDNDPRECTDLSERPEQADTRNRMRNALRDHLASYGDPHVVDGELTVRPPGPLKAAVSETRAHTEGEHSPPGADHDDRTQRIAVYDCDAEHRVRGVRFEGCTVAGKPLTAPDAADVQINDYVDDVTFG
jgi:hypothetical protein